MQYLPFYTFKKPKNYGTDFIVPTSNNNTNNNSISSDEDDDNEKIEFSSDNIPKPSTTTTTTTTTKTTKIPYHSFIEITKTVKYKDDTNDNNKKRKFQEKKFEHCNVVIENVNVNDNDNNIESDDTETVIEDYSDDQNEKEYKKQEEGVDDEIIGSPTPAINDSLPHDPIHLENFIINNLPLKEISDKLKMGILGEKLIREFSRFYTILILNDDKGDHDDSDNGDDSNIKFQASPLVQLFWRFGLNDILINNQFKAFNRFYKLNEFNIESQMLDPIEIQRKRYKKTLKFYNKYFSTAYDSVFYLKTNIWPIDYLKQENKNKFENNEEYGEEKDEELKEEEGEEIKKEDSDDDYVDDEEKEGEEEQHDDQINFNNEKKLKRYNVKKKSSSSMSTFIPPVTRSRGSVSPSLSSPSKIISRSRSSLSSLPLLSELSSLSPQSPLLKKLKKSIEIDSNNNYNYNKQLFKIGSSVEARCNSNGKPYDNTFFDGKVLSYNKRNGKYLIQYDMDGTEEFVDKFNVKPTSSIEVTLNNFKKGKQVIFKKDNSFWYGPATLLSKQTNNNNDGNPIQDNYKIEYLNHIYNLKFNPKTPICYFY